jgi:hypothetical protein
MSYLQCCQARELSGLKADRLIAGQEDQMDRCFDDINNRGNVRNCLVQRLNQNDLQY